MKVLVTGAAGFIGSHVAEALVNYGHTVVGVDNLSSGKLENLPQGISFIKADIRLSDQMEGVFRSFRPDAVIHHAAQISVSNSVRDPEYDADVNITGMLRLLKLCVAYSVRGVIFASSGGVLYGDVYSPANEESPLRPQSPYGIAKLAGELYLQHYNAEHGLNSVALRYGNVYGSRQDPAGEAGVVAIFAGKMLKGEKVTINGDGEYVRDYVFVKDVVDANLRALEWCSHNRGTRAFNVGTGCGTSVNQLYAMMASVLRIAVEPNYGPPRPGDLRSSLLDPARAAAELGWKPHTNLRQGLEVTLDWFRSRYTQATQ